MFKTIATTLAVVCASAVVTVAPLTTASPASAIPACNDGTVYSHSYVGVRFRTTAMHSDAASGGQRVSIAIGKSATNSLETITNTTVSAKVKAGYGPISAEINASASSTRDVRNTTTTTLQVRYSATVPRGKSAREMRWARQNVYNVTARHGQAVQVNGIWTCQMVRDWTARVAFPAAVNTFVWDWQDLPSNKPGCKVPGYPSYGAGICPTI